LILAYTGAMRFVNANWFYCPTGKQNSPASIFAYLQRLFGLEYWRGQAIDHPVLHWDLMDEDPRVLLRLSRWIQSKLKGQF
jgi:hypothetical protein